MSLLDNAGHTQHLGLSLAPHSPTPLLLLLLLLPSAFCRRSLLTRVNPSTCAVICSASSASLLRSLKVWSHLKLKIHCLAIINFTLIRQLSKRQQCAKMNTASDEGSLGQAQYYRLADTLYTFLWLHKDVDEAQLKRKGIQRNILELGSKEVFWCLYPYTLYCPKTQLLLL